MISRDDARDLGLFLRYAFDASASPGRLDAYGRVLELFHAAPELRTAANEVLRALGTTLLAADRTAGFVLAAEPGSPLAVTYTRKLLPLGGTQHRLVYGLALAGVTAWCFPNARAVREPGTRRVTALDVDRLIRGQAAAIEAGSTEGEGGLGPAWEAYDRQHKQVVATKKSGRLRRNTTAKMCEDVLQLLASFNLLVADTTMPPPRRDLSVWRSTDRFRAHVAATGAPLVRQVFPDWSPEQRHSVEPPGGVRADSEEG
ncbi:hypothetical protein ACFU99_08890 [Streptomyces sp. NPDC057654]|uniref:hypothetical protein n=1 Tax=Streptomyces sp. NPDC057654 TaxID=3346196 RepID=UPI0036951BC9